MTSSNNPEQRRLGRHALVCGGSVTGLLVGRVLSDYFERVTIIERDEVGDTAEARKGVPHAKHTHVLLPSGVAILTALLPDLPLGEPETGTAAMDVGEKLRWYQRGIWKVRFHSGLSAYLCERTRFEQSVRRRVTALPNITVLEHHRLTRLLTDERQSRVIGAEVNDLGDDGRRERIDADLVVDAMGRGTMTPRWLAETTVGAPPVTEVAMNMGYASRIYRKPDDFENGWHMLLIHPTPPQTKRMGMVYPLDDERLMVTLGGWVGDHAPANDDGFLAFARSLPVSELHELLSRTAPMSPIHIYKIPAAKWRRYEKLARWPRGFVVIGDAVCAFNPIYSQGITSSAMQVQALRESLQQISGRARQLTEVKFERAFQKRVAAIIKTPWMLATSEDFRFPETRGARPFGTRFLHWYSAQLVYLSATNQRIYHRVLHVLAMLRGPASLFHPSVLFAVLKGSLLGARRDRAADPTQALPPAVPTGDDSTASLP